MAEAIRNRTETRVECPDELFARFSVVLSEMVGSFEKREAAAMGLANELVRRWIEQDLSTMSTRFGAEVRVDGQRYRRHADGAVKYHTLCGAVNVRRASYRQVGVHNGPTVVPLELEAGIWHNATPALAFSIAQGFAERPLWHYESELRAAHRHVPSRSTLERVGKRIGHELQRSIIEIEPDVRRDEPLLDRARSVSIGIDRTTVPMAEPAAYATTERLEPRIRRAPPPIVVAYRMAYVATVSLHDERGRVLSTKRFAATPIEGPSDILARVADEIRHLRERHALLPLTIVQDGAPELWNLVARLQCEYGIVAAVEVIDRFHVDERLAAVCELLSGGARLLDQWRTSLDRSDTAIDRICRRLDQLMHHMLFAESEGHPMPRYWRKRAAHLSEQARCVISGHLEYLFSHRRRLRYATPLRLGFPIGSGPTEGACKSVVTMRFKRSGQRWFEPGLAPCLSLRAIHLSERLPACFAASQAARFASLHAA